MNLFTQKQPDFNAENKPGNNFIGISIGTSDFHVRDELASPLTFRNNGLTAGINYTNRSNKHIHQIELIAFYGNIHSNYKEFFAENIRAAFRYDYLHQFLAAKLFKNDFAVYAGGGLYSFFNTSEYRSDPELLPGQVTESWYLSHSFETSVLLDYLKNKPDHFTFQFYLPLVSNIARPPYSYIPGKGRYPFKLFGTNTVFWENFIIQVKTGYEHSFSQKFILFVQYDFQYSSDNSQREIKLFMNNMRAGLKLRF